MYVLRIRIQDSKKYANVDTRFLITKKRIGQNITPRFNFKNKLFSIFLHNYLKILINE